MWPAMDLGNRGVFMKLGKFETEGGEFPGLKVCKMEWDQREREREIEEKTWRGDQKKGREEEERRNGEKEKR